MNKLKFYATVKKGDILLTLNKSNLFSKAIAIGTKSKYSHVSMYIGYGKILESTYKYGASLSLADKYVNKNYSICILRLKDNSKMNRVIKNLKEKIGIKYSNWQVLFFIPIFLIKLIFNIDLRKDINFDFDKTGDICSEYISRAILEEKNIQIVNNIDSSLIVPQDFYINKYIDIILEG